MPAVKQEELPLDEKFETHHDPVTGISQSIPMLDAKWIEQEDVEFISYVPPAINVNLIKQTAQTDENELLSWEERARFINNDLKWLLCQPHNKFWNQVIFNKSINSCLDSFLKLSPRSFDVWKFLPEKILNLQKQLHRSVFMVYLRMSTNKESKKDFFTPTIFGDILYENFLFDIPKIMDLCSLYGGDNSGNTPLLTKMLENVFNKQPKYLDDLHEMIPSIFVIFEQIEQEFGVNSGVVAEGLANHNRSGVKTRNVDEIVHYLFDTCQTLLSLFQTLPNLCQHFFKVGLAQRIGSFWNEVMPLIAQKYRGTEYKTARHFLKRCKMALVRICHITISASCLEPLVDCDKEIDDDTKEGYVEDFLSVVSELLSFKQFLRVYYRYHDIESDMDIIQRCAVSVDEARLHYIISAVHESNDNRVLKSKSNVRKNKTGEVVNGTGTIGEPLTRGQSPLVVKTNFTDAELHSMVSNVKDLFPDYTEELIITCLKRTNYDVEKAINFIIEDGIPADLQNGEPHRSEDDIAPDPSDVLTTRHSIFDKDEFDVFSKAHVDLSRVHKGKSRTTDNVNTILSDKQDIGSVKEFVLNYDENFNDYEDEYDDTYDTQDVGAQDIDSADELSELTLRRAFTTPLVLRNMGDISDDENKSSDSGKPSASNSNPSETADTKDCRDRDAAPPRHGNPRHGNGAEAFRGKRNYESGKNKERDRAHKDKNKAKIANHNRKAGAAKKQARGMAF